jgi:4a-hydroxytetrahydrobiopterin dehydratase
LVGLREGVRFNRHQTNVNLALSYQNEFFIITTPESTMSNLLPAKEIKERLKKIPEWEAEKKHIERTFEFDDFSAALDFVNQVGDIAEDEDHHPDIDIRYNKVRVALSTHSEGGVTDMDFDVAEKIERLME